MIYTTTANDRLVRDATSNHTIAALFSPGSPVMVNLTFALIQIVELVCNHLYIHELGREFQLFKHGYLYAH